MDDLTIELPTSYYGDQETLLDHDPRPWETDYDVVPDYAYDDLENERDYEDPYGDYYGDEEYYQALYYDL